MASSLLRYLVNVVVLLTMTVAGLPLVVCVSEAHGASIEVDRSYLISSSYQNPKQHHVLFGNSEQSAESPDCKDFRLQRGPLVAQSRHEKVAGVGTLSDGKSPVVPDIAAYDVKAPSYVGPDRKFVRRTALILRSALSDRRTIVLHI